MSTTDSALEKLFAEYEILSHVEHDGFFRISAAQIKKFREPRLMTKFNHKVNLPKIFFEQRTFNFSRDARRLFDFAFQGVKKLPADKFARHTSNVNPQLFVMQYSPTLNVTDLTLVPKFFFTPHVIEKRKSLSSAARRT